MMEAELLILKNDEFKIKYVINTRHLAIKILFREEIPGAKPFGQPDLKLTIRCETLADMFTLGYYVAKETGSFTL